MVKTQDFYTFLRGTNGSAVAEALTKNTKEIELLKSAVDEGFVLMSGYLVFFMQLGFAMLTAGSVRSKNTKNALLKNLLDACVGSLAYYLFGYAFAYGSQGLFIGWGQFAASRGNLTEWFFQWAFAATAATIVSGSVAERTSFYAYMAYAFFITGFVYPLVSHWVWGNGFLMRGLFGVSMVDFAGCAVVHIVGGFAGLSGSYIVGPRIGRFNSAGEVQAMPGHSAPLVTLGTFVLWFGWYGFNPGSALGLSDGKYLVVARCAVTTTLSAASGGITTLIVKKKTDHIFDLTSVLNGVLAGLVSITSSCAFVETYAALIIGSIGALVYLGAAALLLKLKIDDPLEAFPIHGAAGIWGVSAAGIFARKDLLDAAGFAGKYAGLFYGPNPGYLLGINLLGTLIIIGWTLGTITPLFLLMKHFSVLRLPKDEEIIGYDISKLGGVAYPDGVAEGGNVPNEKLIDNLH